MGQLADSFHSDDDAYNCRKQVDFLPFLTRIIFKAYKSFHGLSELDPFRAVSEV